MARIVRKRKPHPPAVSPLAALMEKHLQALRVLNYSEYTVKNRRVHLGFFIQWCHDRGIAEPTEITRPILEHYQRYLFHYRQKSGRPLSFRSQHSSIPKAAFGLASSCAAFSKSRRQAPGLCIFDWADLKRHRQPCGDDVT